MDAQTRRLQDCPQEGDGRAFAIGAGDMDHWRQAALGVAERVKDAPHAIEREIDQPWVQPQEARDDGIRAKLRGYPYRALHCSR